MAAITGVVENTLFNYLSGRSDLKVSVLVAIANATGANVAWLATGEGPMMRSDSESARLSGPAATLPGAPEGPEESLVDVARQPRGMRLTKEREKRRALPKISVNDQWVGGPNAMDDWCGFADDDEDGDEQEVARSAPPESPAPVVNATPLVPESFRRFAPDIDLAVTGYARCSTTGHLEGDKKHPDLPMPDGLREVDGDAFYVVAKGSSMIPEGIEDGDYCLVSPNTSLSAGLRVWLKDRQKRACIKRLVDITDKTYKLRGWLDPVKGRAQNYDDEWMISNIAEKGVVLAVYRGKPDPKNPPEMIADPRARKGAPPDHKPPHQAAQTDSPGAPSHRLEADKGTVATVAAKDPHEVATHPDFVAIPRYDVEAAAGSGGAFVDQELTTGYYAFSRVWLRRRGLIIGKLSVISISGDSMEPDLHKGDLVLIDHAQTRPRDGLIYIVRYSDGLYAKRVQMLLGSQVDLVSSNSLYKPISVKLDEAADFAVIGRVVASVHEW
ncbi:MAG: S24 family peptidase [Hyphomicrobiales bacterium]